MEMHNGRPCKACVSVEDMMRMSREAAKAKGKAGEGAPKASTSPKQPRKDCPVDKDELGRSTWNLLHTMAAYYPEQPTAEEKQNMAQVMDALSKTYPCPPCAEDLRKDLKQNPPTLEDRTAFSRWMCEMHNRVNLKLGKDKFDCTKVMERWYDGWKDGSCDY